MKRKKRERDIMNKKDLRTEKGLTLKCYHVVICKQLGYVFTHFFFLSLPPSTTDRVLHFFTPILFCSIRTQKYTNKNRITYSIFSIL